MRIAKIPKPTRRLTGRAPRIVDAWIGGVWAAAKPPGMNLLGNCHCRRRIRISTVPAEVAHDGVDFGTVEDLFFEQRLGNFMEQPEIGSQEVFGLVITLLDDASDLGVDFNGGAF